MARVVKHPAVRRAELLDHAQALFFARGYEATTVNDVLDAAAVSKGGFYHHFGSKEDLLEAIAARAAEQALEALLPAMEGAGPGAVDQLNAFFAAGRRLKSEGAAQWRAAFSAVLKPENVVLNHRVQAAMTAAVAPALAAVIARGRDQGVFRVSDPEPIAEIILNLSAINRAALARLVLARDPAEAAGARAALEARLRLQGVVIDRILGLPEGTIVYVDEALAPDGLGPD